MWSPRRPRVLAEPGAPAQPSKPRLLSSWGAGSSNRATLGQRIIELRAGRGWNLAKLASESRLPYSTVHDLEKGVTVAPSPEAVEQLAEGLALPEDQRMQLRELAERARAEQRAQRAQRRPNRPDASVLGQHEPARVVGTAPAAASPSPPAKVLGRTGPRWPGRKVVVGLTVALVVLLGAVAALVESGRDEQQVTASSGAAEATGASPVDITFPLDGQAVESPLVVRGVTRVQIEPDKALWLMVKPVKDTTYYLTTDRAITVAQDGQWASRVRLGRGPQDEGAETDLLVVLAPHASSIDEAIARRPPEDYSARFLDVPDDVTVIKRLRITLGRYVGQ